MLKPAAGAECVTALKRSALSRLQVTVAYSAFLGT